MIRTETENKGTRQGLDLLEFRVGVYLLGLHLLLGWIPRYRLLNSRWLL